MTLNNKIYLLYKIAIENGRLIIELKIHEKCLESFPINYPVVVRELRSVWGIHIPCTFPIKWGASWSYLEFPNHLIAYKLMYWHHSYIYYGTLT